jgi:hypothetical protein
VAFRATGQVLGALGVCAAVAVCTLYVTKSTAQSTKEDQPRTESTASPVADEQVAINDFAYQVANDPSMSALVQKRTCAVHQAMSALCQ